MSTDYFCGFYFKQNVMVWYAGVVRGVVIFNRVIVTVLKNDVSMKFFVLMLIRPRSVAGDFY